MYAVLVKYAEARCIPDDRFATEQGALDHIANNLKPLAVDSWEDMQFEVVPNAEPPQY